MGQVVDCKLLFEALSTFEILSLVVNPRIVNQHVESMELLAELLGEVLHGLEIVEVAFYKVKIRIVCLIHHFLNRLSGFLFVSAGKYDLFFIFAIGK